MSLTAKICGDPDENRFAKAETIRRRMAAVIAREPAPAVHPSIAATLRALADGPLNFSSLRDAMGVKTATTESRLAAARGGGLVIRDCPSPNPGRYHLTDRGRQLLAEIGR
jgi:hypothetical protein